MYKERCIKKDVLKCPICLEDYKEDEQISGTSCKHFFHKNCIFEWFKKAGSNFYKCPSCRAHLEISIHPEDAELNDKLKKVGLGLEMETINRTKMTDAQRQLLELLIDAQLEFLLHLGYTIE
uniref:RING-type domain-containing protein n=1 Tax=Meloidogyne incognita TaxID=6306 RepID=A0A914LSS8_MELIC